MARGTFCRCAPSLALRYDSFFLLPPADNATTGLQNYRNETSEVTELGPHALHKRTIKSTRKKKERQSKANPKRTSVRAPVPPPHPRGHTPHDVTEPPLTRYQSITATARGTTTSSACS